MENAKRQFADSILERAQAAYLSSDLSRCESLARDVILADPDCLPGILLVGFCCARTRRREEAIRLFESALVIDADSIEAHIALSTLYIDSGRIAEGNLHGLRIIELDPTDMAPALNLARILTAKKAYAEAINVWQILISRFSSNLDFLRKLAFCQIEAKQKKDAIETWQEVVRRAPRSTPDLLELGKAYLADSQSQNAILTSEKILQVDRKNIDAHMLAAMALSESGRAREAEVHLGRVLQVQPNNPIALASLGLSMQEQGRFDHARIPLTQSVELWPSNGLAYYALIRSQKVTSEESGLLESIEKQVTKPAVDPLHAAYMRYALGKGFEDLKDYESSFANYKEANRISFDHWLAHRPWDRERYTFTFDRTIEVFDRERISSLQSKSSNSQRPLFVVGMIRSGTTLVEQILSSHPDIVAAGEQTFWHEHVGRIFDPVNRVVNTEEMENVVTEYLALLNQFSTTSARVTDKLPHNYALIGIIKAAIPGARFIHIQRNPLDNCLSIFTTAYQRPPAFTLDIGNIVFAYKQYQRIMQHWRNQLGPEDLFEVQYEDLVQNRDAVTKAMISFSGVEWSEDCLSPEKNSRSVHTPSTWQVRQPIYSTSVERWRHFEPWLGEFEGLRS